MYLKGDFVPYTRPLPKRFLQRELDAEAMREKLSGDPNEMVLRQDEDKPQPLDKVFHD